MFRKHNLLPNKVMIVDQEPTCKALVMSGIGLTLMLEDEALEAEKQLAKQADELNERFAPWVYTISKWRCGTLITDVEGLLEKDKDK